MTMDTTARLSITEASRLCGISVQTLWSRIGRGLKSYRADDGYHRLVSLADITAWKDRRAEKSGRRQRGDNALRVVALYGLGYPDRQIATVLGISFQRVSKLRQRAGLTRLPRVAHGTTCRKCGTQFFATKRGQNICVEHRRKAAEILAFRCQECGAPFQRRASTIRPTSPGNYCSRACRDQAKRGRGHVNSVLKCCTECGRDYMGLPSARWTVCQPCRPMAWYRRTKSLQHQG